uniref:ATP-dependent DNA helicase n=1 Tax=Cajanus cajan TaxID=3821 RepID=A0A151S5M0_CAJCA|nr:hypothetical protein KK1_028219 [Cajanus cajan]
MIHGPCGTLNPNSPCMKNGQCKKMYPKQFYQETRQGHDSYPQYRRRFNHPVSVNRNVTIDNRWVVPYNPWLLLKYNYHINVEVCSSIKSIKYLYKYVYKGGTGKTFLYRTLIANVRSKGQIILATASSGIAPTLLPGGRIAHSRFKIPINVEADSFCSISKQSDLAKLIRKTTAII